MTGRFPFKGLAVALVLAAAAGLAFWTGYTYGPRLLTARLPGGVPPISDRLALEQFAPPRPAPAVAFTDRHGAGLRLADFRGRVVLVNLWATWCAPCRREMPALDRLAARLAGADFVVLPLSLDRGGAEAVARFYGELGLTHLGIFLDPSGRAADLFGAPGLPTTFLIDRGGREVVRKAGPADWDGPRMLALVRRYLPPGAAGDGPESRR